MKIALVLCPFLYKRCPLIGLAYLSAYLKDKGFGNTSYLHTHPEEFNVELKEGGEWWESKDKLNTHEERQKRIKIFNDFVYSLGIPLNNCTSITKKANNLSKDLKSYKEGE